MRYEMTEQMQEECVSALADEVLAGAILCGSPETHNHGALGDESVITMTIALVIIKFDDQE